MAANSSGASVYAKHPTITGLYVGLTDSTSTAGVDPITFCIFKNVSPDTTANTYHHGCIAQVTSEATGLLSVYVNTGSYAVPAWTDIGALPPGEISLAEGKMLRGSSNGTAETQEYFGSVAVQTNGTTLVPLFGATNTFKGTLTSVQVISGSTTSVNVTLSNSGTSYDVEATSTTKGAVTGSATFAAMAFTVGGSVNVVNSSAIPSGTATVIATFITGQ